MTRPLPALVAGLILVVGGVPAVAAPETKGDPATATPMLVELTVKGTLPEEPAPLGLEGDPITDNLKTLLDKIAKAKADDNVKGLVLRLRTPAFGLAKTNELRRALKDFRSSGKKTFAVLEMAGNVDYLIATAADEIVMPESAWLMVKGLAAEVTFYKGLFDKLGIKADMMQMGKYKGAAEPYTRTEMSPAFREELTEVLTDSYNLLAEAIAERQGIAVAEAKALIDQGPYTPRAAKAAGLINRIAYDDQLESEIAKGIGLPKVRLETKYGKKTETTDYSGLAGFLKMMQALSGDTTKKPESKNPKVAVIYASGMIMPGKSSSGGLLGEAVMGSDTVVKHLKEAEKDKTVKAIVLRVDSPGGSALASDLIWREVTRIEKPIVASMSDTAASGGYYISMGCDRIFAEPATLTGSIGVVGGKLALGGLMEKLGVTTDTVTVGKNGTILSVVRPFSDSERAAMRALMEETYKQFVAKAAQGRKMEVEKLEALAGGRIYSGRQALRAGLVDELGTLSDAIAAAKKLGGLEKEEKVEILTLPRAKSLFEDLLQPLEDRDTKAPAFEQLLPEPVRGAGARLGRLARLMATEPVVLVLPFEVRIR